MFVFWWCLFSFECFPRRNEESRLREGWTILPSLVRGRLTNSGPAGSWETQTEVIQRARVQSPATEGKVREHSPSRKKNLGPGGDAQLGVNFRGQIISALRQKKRKNWGGSGETHPPQLGHKTLKNLWAGPRWSVGRGVWTLPSYLKLKTQKILRSGKGPDTMPKLLGNLWFFLKINQNAHFLNAFWKLCLWNTPKHGKKWVISPQNMKPPLGGLVLPPKYDAPHPSDGKADAGVIQEKYKNFGGYNTF